MTTKAKTLCEWFILAALLIRPSLDVTTSWFVPVGPVRLNPAAVLGFLLLGAGLLWFISLTKQERLALVKQPLIAVYLLFLVLMLPWGLFSPELNGAPRLSAFREWIRLASYLPLLMVAFYIAQKEGPRRVVWALLGSIVLPLLFGLYQILFLKGLMIQEAHRITGTFVHPNPFSFYLVLMIGVTYWLLRTSPTWKWWAALLTLETGVLIATYSFTGAGMFGILILVLALSENRTARRVTLALMIIFPLVFVATPTGRQRIIKVTKWENLDEIERTGRETSSMVWRALNWRFLYRTWKEQPLLGYGLNSAPTVNPNRVYQGRGPGQEPHNDYVRFLVDTGIIGSMVWLIFLATVGWSLLMAYRRSKNHEQQRLALAALAIYLTWLAGSFNDNLLNAAAYQYFLWTVFALSVGGSCLTVKNEDTTEELSV